jgi:hypothetical protein
LIKGDGDIKTFPEEIWRNTSVYCDAKGKMGVVNLALQIPQDDEENFEGKMAPSSPDFPPPRSPDLPPPRSPDFPPPRSPDLPPPRTPEVPPPTTP